MILYNFYGSFLYTAMQAVYLVAKKQRTVLKSALSLLTSQGFRLCWVNTSLRYRRWKGLHSGSECGTLSRCIRLFNPTIS